MIEMVNYKTGFRKPRFLKHLSEFAGVILTDLKKKDADVNIVLCDDKFIRDLNRRYRHKNKATDVLSFAQKSEDEEFFDGDETLGDIIISIDTALRQAVEFEVTFEEEMARLMIHGMLHLLGYDHETSKADEKKMFAKQDKYLEKYLKKYMKRPHR